MLNEHISEYAVFKHSCSRLHSILQSNRSCWCTILQTSTSCELVDMICRQLRWEVEVVPNEQMKMRWGSNISEDEEWKYWAANGHGVKDRLPAPRHSQEFSNLIYTLLFFLSSRVGIQAWLPLNPQNLRTTFITFYKY